MTRINKENSQQVRQMRANGKSTREIQQNLADRGINVSERLLEVSYQWKNVKHTVQYSSIQ